jgi:D-psicose/D-tagatose/L-ribulose 3-epimerase
MRYGASTFIWVSRFFNTTLDLVDRIKEFGFDLIEVCIEYPDTIDPSAIRARVTSVDLGVTVCGALVRTVI